jgi:hypothetical protein
MTNDEAHSRLSRRNLLRAAGATGLVAATAGAVTLGAASPAMAAQSNWFFCEQCACLWYGGNGALGYCWGNLGAFHVSSGGNYKVKYISEGGGGQANWRWCSWCSALHWSSGACPGNMDLDDAHNTAGSGFYMIETSQSKDGPGGQAGWRYCEVCSCLWYSGNNRVGACVRGQPHDRSNRSFDYILREV